jgi:hypothetical protein
MANPFVEGFVAFAECLGLSANFQFPIVHATIWLGGTTRSLLRGCPQRFNPRIEKWYRMEDIFPSRRMCMQW